MVRNKIVCALAVVMLSCSLSTGVCAREVKDSTSGVVDIKLSTDGLFNLSSEKGNGKILYSYKVGSSKETLSSPTYPCAVKEYNADGTFKRDIAEGTTMFATGDYSDWLSSNYNIVVDDNTEYGKYEGAKIAPATKFKGSDDDWFRVDTNSDTKFVEIDAVYQYEDGTYSDVVSKVFDYNVEELADIGVPDLQLTELKRTGNQLTLQVSSSTKDSSVELSYLEIYNENTKKTKTVQLNGTSHSYSYPIVANGKYRFKVFTTKGEWTWLEWTESNITGVIEESEDFSAPVVAFSGVPDIVEYGDHFVLHLNMDRPCSFDFNGVSYKDEQNVDIDIYSNGTYTFHIVGANGMSTDASIDISCFPESNNLDSDTVWSDGGIISTLKNKALPQTGGMSLVGYILGGLGLVVLGVLALSSKGHGLFKRVLGRKDIQQ